MIHFAGCWIAVAAFAVDRLAKIWASGALSDCRSIPLLFGALRLFYVENTGAAFGILRGQRVLLLCATGIALLALLLYLLFRAEGLSRLPRAALWLLMGGALGNFADRLLFGYVVDFIEIRLFRFPVFNVADICIVLAFICLAGTIFFSREERHDA